MLIGISKTSKALFLDRDGTLIEHKPYLHKPEDVVLLPGTTEALRRARAAGYLLFLFTNQSGVGRGYFTMEDVSRVHTRLIELIGLGPDIFIEICVAPEHPDAPSPYRKPSPRFIHEMIAKYDLVPAHCWMIGDSPSDWRSGLGAGIPVAAVRSDLTTAASLAEAGKCSIAIHDDLMSFIRSGLPFAL
jgi:D-glycero-D-manno-heptose 1,7-bisphosphate phosphatase